MLSFPPSRLLLLRSSSSSKYPPVVRCCRFCLVGLGRRPLTVLGIESSCDDAAVSIVDFDARRVLADQRSSDLVAHSRVRGISPYLSAAHHRAAIPRLIDAALAESGRRASDMDAVAVSTRPGLVLCLKAGIDCALGFARDFHRPLVPVHHMRAHAMVQRLLDPQLRFPFSALLISGAHCLVCLAQSPRQFQILAEASGGSPGQCLDQLAKGLGLQPLEGHFGAALEKMANNCPPEHRLKFGLSLPALRPPNLGPNFDMVKQRYLHVINRRTKKMRWSGGGDGDELAQLCAGIQHSVIELVCQHLEPALVHLTSSVPEFAANPAHRNLVVAGGVASNARFLERIREVAAAHRFTVQVPPRHLCTDNGVMVAWTGAEIFAHLRADQRNQTAAACDANWEDIYWPDALPDTLWASYRSDIGPRRTPKAEEEKETIDEQNQPTNPYSQLNYHQPKLANV